MVTSKFSKKCNFGATKTQVSPKRYISRVTTKKDTMVGQKINLQRASL